MAPRKDGERRIPGANSQLLQPGKYGLLVVQPKDFTDEPHETLSADLTEGVHYGPQVKIVKTRTRMTPRPDRPEAAGATSEEKKSLIDNGR